MFLNSRYILLWYYLHFFINLFEKKNKLSSVGDFLRKNKNYYKNININTVKINKHIKN